MPKHYSFRLGVESGFLTWVPVQAGKRCYLPTIHGDHTEWRQDVEDRSGTGIF
jgi:hypothetical protein